MSRSGLVRSFVRMHRLVRAAREVGRAPDELAERERERRLSRREWLLGSAAAGAGVVVGCAPRATPWPRPPARPSGGATNEVVIVGAGLAGLCCAHHLGKAGVGARVHEASSRIGGRVFTDRSTFADGMHAELGGELIDTGHETMHALAAELGIELYDYRKDDPALEPIVAHFGGRRFGEVELLREYAPIAARIDAALEVLHDPEGDITYRTPNGAEALDRQSIRQWLDSIGASGPARDLLETAYVIEFGLDAEDSSALNLLWMISTETDALALFGDSDELFHAKEGNDRYVERLAERLAPGTVELESRLVSVSLDADGRYRLGFERGRTLTETAADHVVLALPFTMLREVKLSVDLPPVKQRAIAELGYGTNTKIMAGFSSRPWRAAGSNGETFTDAGYQSSWETSRLQPGESGILTFFTGGATGIAMTKGSTEERGKQLVGALDRVFPGVAAAADGKLARFAWPTHPFTRGSYSAYRVGQYTSFAGAESERVGNLHFAGEHTSIEAQGFMEGAAKSGIAAAGEILADLGLSRKAKGAA